MLGMDGWRVFFILLADTKALATRLGGGRTDSASHSHPNADTSFFNVRESAKTKPLVKDLHRAARPDARRDPYQPATVFTADNEEV